MVGRAKKKGASGGGEFTLFDDAEPVDAESDEDLPRDEAGRAKIKNQYVELLGIRVQKLAGRILNRERINKTLEGIYFVCIRCKKVCHNLDEGLVEDPENSKNVCTPCTKAEVEDAKAAAKKAAAPRLEDLIAEASPARRASGAAVAAKALAAAAAAVKADGKEAPEAPAEPAKAPAAKPSKAPAAKGDAAPESKASAPEAAGKAAAKPAGKPAAKPATKPAPKAAAKPEPKATAKPAAKPAAKPPAKPAAKQVAKPAAKAAAKPAPKGGAKPAAAKKK